MNAQRQEAVLTRSSFTPVPSGLLQRKCACGNHAMTGGECKECGKKRQTVRGASLRHSGKATESEGEVPPIVHKVLRSPGQLLDPATRAFFEPRFKHDFSQVRVHTDAMAAKSARAVNALGYTVGRDVVFGTGQYGPFTEPGRKLLSHELAHVVQQEGTKVRPDSGLFVTPPDGILERQAEAAAIHSSAAVLSVTGNARAPAFIQRAVEEAGTQTGAGTTELEDACAGWFSDHESTSKRAAEHYVRTELAGNRGVVEKIECDLFNPDTGAFACTVHFTDGTPIRVIVRRDAIIVGVYPLQTMHPPPDRPLCWYDYRCSGPNRDLVLTKRKCQTSQSAGGSPPPKTHGPEP